MDKISVVLCVRNCVTLVRNNLPRLKEALSGAEIIVVDGDSTDGTTQAAQEYADKVVSDGGKGLAYARQLGITTASRPFVSFVGADNLTDVELMHSMKDALEADDMLAGVAPQTEVVDAHSYWERTTKYFFKYLINRPGPAEVIGTPCMWKRDVLLRIPYDPAIRGGADDTDLALRLGKEGYTLRIIDAYAREKNTLAFSDFVGRWRFYGAGDAEFYNKNKSHWSFVRRIRSLLHPFYTYGLRGAWIFLINGCPQYIPGLYVGVWARYTGWIRRARGV